MSRIDNILDFWFGRPDDPDYGTFRAVWFQPTPEFNAALEASFLEDYKSAAAGDYDDWQETPRGSLALLILLDQLPANLFRSSPKAFAADAKALAVAKNAVERGFDRAVPEIQRWFFYLPFEHSESLPDQRRSVELFRSLSDTPSNRIGLDYAERHLRVIERFGRFPNRNEALGRASTPEEVEFLAGPNAPF